MHRGIEAAALTSHGEGTTQEGDYLTDQANKLEYFIVNVQNTHSFIHSLVHFDVLSMIYYPVCYPNTLHTHKTIKSVPTQAFLLFFFCAHAFSSSFYFVVATF